MEGTRDDDTPGDGTGDSSGGPADAADATASSTDSSSPPPGGDSDVSGTGAADEEGTAIRGPHPSASGPDDPFAVEPPWLQSGSGRRTALGVTAIVVLLALVAGVGWLAFRPETDTDVTEDEPATVACDVTEHDDPTMLPLPRLGEAPPRRTATVTTNLGTVTVLLFGDVAPCGVSGFSHLAQQNFYTNSPCYRITTQPIDPTVTLRCGDPQATGKGGPGFRYRAEDLYTGQTGSNYFALINDRSGMAGSAFAFVRGESKPTDSLAVIGQVIDGFTVLDQIGGTAGLNFDDAPPQPITILSVTLADGTVTLPPSQRPTPTDDGPVPGDDGRSSEPADGSSSVPLPFDPGSGPSTEPGPRDVPDPVA